MCLRGSPIRVGKCPYSRNPVILNRNFYSYLYAVFKVNTSFLFPTIRVNRFGVAGGYPQLSHKKLTCSSMEIRDSGEFENFSMLAAINKVNGKFPLTPNKLRVQLSLYELKRVYQGRS